MNLQDQQSTAKGNSLVEKLVRTIARAFYTDSFVIVLEILIREKYLREEEFAPRLKLVEKDVNKVVRQLESEMLIRYEDMVMDDGRTSKCYYIDYQIFANVIRYRIDLMVKAISSAERIEFNEVFFQCPTCSNRYSSLEAQKLLSADYKFICSSCCPTNILSKAVSQPYYRLMEIDNRNKLNDVQDLEKKMDDQLNESNEHVGIFDLLRDLQNLSLIHNLPSDNRLRGIVASRVVDEEVQEEIQLKMKSKTSNQIHKKFVKQQQMMGHNGSVFSVNIEDQDEQSFADNQLLEQQSKKPKDASYPEFLANSRVKTADSLVQGTLSFSSSDMADNTEAPTTSSSGFTEVAKEEQYKAFGKLKEEIEIGRVENIAVKDEIVHVAVADENKVDEEDDDVDWED